MADAALECLTFDSPEEFLAETGSFFRGREAENKIVLGALRNWADADSDLMAVARGGAIRLAALRTPPFNLVLSHGDGAAVPSLIASLRAAGIQPPGVVGPVALAERFAAEWQSATGQAAEPLHGLLLSCLTEVVWPGPVPGVLRPVAEDDAAWCCRRPRSRAPARRPRA